MVMHFCTPVFFLSCTVLQNLYTLACRLFLLLAFCSPAVRSLPVLTIILHPNGGKEISHERDYSFVYGPSSRMN